MPLMLLGLVFAIGLFIYYIVSTSPSKGRGRSPEKNGETKQDEDLKKEENVIFLPDDIEEIKKRHRKNQ